MIARSKILFAVTSLLVSATCLPSFANASDPVLRHAVFFEFKESSSADAVDHVVSQFDALPEKIDAIKTYTSGVSIKDANSDGLTHAFLVGFDDQAGLAEYLPAEPHQAFVKILRPQLKHAFVFDFWGTTCPLTDRHLKHAVFLKFKPDASEEAIEEVVETFLLLGDQIDTVHHIEGGVNQSDEAKADGFTHGFIVSFDDEAGLKTYRPHPAHQELVRQLKPVMDKLRVIDFYVQP